MADTNPNPAAPVQETKTLSRRGDAIPYQRRSIGPTWRERVTEGFKTFLWIAPLTALIWIYAERAQIAPLEAPVTIDVKSNSNDRVVTVLLPIDDRVTLDMRAPRASLDAIRERLSTSAKPIEVIIPDDIAPGFEGDISITDRIERNPIFQQWAVDVERSFPPVRIRVEKKSFRELPVRLAPEDSGFASVTFDPPTVRIEGPQSIIDKIPPDQAVYADLEKLRGYPPGMHPPTSVTVKGFTEENVKKIPAKVNATVEIRQGQTYSLPSVLIYTNVPPTMMKFERHVVAPQRPTLPNVDVTGPPAQIERLKPGGDFTPKVRVTIDPKDLEQTEFIKRVTAADFELPPDVKVLNPNRDIPYTVSPR